LRWYYLHPSLLPLSTAYRTKKLIGVLPNPRREIPKTKQTIQGGCDKNNTMMHKKDNPMRGNCRGSVSGRA
jgi:hypothetical protein